MPRKLVRRPQLAEDVQVAESYSVKKWQGKSGFVELSSSTDSKVMVAFPDGSCKLINCKFLEVANAVPG